MLLVGINDALNESVTSLATGAIVHLPRPHLVEFGLVVGAQCPRRRLIITGTQAGRIDGTRQVNAGELVLRAGRPVLVVPAEVEWLKLKSIIVAWKDTREARRAISDALPLLHKAREVIVVELLEAGADQAAAKARVDDVGAWLVRRGISASSIATKALIGVTDRLTILAQDEGASIIVAGAYGRTRFQEWVFGGVTRDLLEQQKCCVLLSH